MAFIQIIEIETTRPDELEALVADMASADRRQAHGATGHVARRTVDRPQPYVQIVEFPSYEAAMANSELPETAQLCAEDRRGCAMGLCSFRNLDVRSVQEM